MGLVSYIPFYQSANQLLLVMLAYFQTRMEGISLPGLESFLGRRIRLPSQKNEGLVS